MPNWRRVTMPLPFNINEGFRAALMANASLVALVADRIFSPVAPLDTAGVWLAFSRISTQKDSAHDGDAQLDRVRFQITVGGSDKDSVDAVLTILHNEFNAMEYTHNNNPTGTAENRVLTFFFEDSRDGYDADDRYVHPTVDLSVWFNTQPQ